MSGCCTQVAHAVPGMHAMYSAGIPRSVGCCTPSQVPVRGLRTRTISGRHKVDQTLIDSCD
jgi:hypothetical protein